MNTVSKMEITENLENSTFTRTQPTFLKKEQIKNSGNNID